MLFGGLVKNSFIDYPHKISCVIFFLGCNFTCPNCHNSDLVLKNLDKLNTVGENNVYDFLKERKKFLDGVVISGGEPTMAKNIFSICKKIKKLGYPIKLDTNGSYPDVLEKLIKDKLIDYVAMDIKTDPYKYSPLINKNCNPDVIISSINYIMNSGIDYEFRTTCVKPFIDENILKSILKFIKGAKLLALQKFIKTNVLSPEFFKDKSLLLKKKELVNLQNIAKEKVKQCIIR